MPDLATEESFGNIMVAGVDEAGRGPWAGPVVAAAVILNKDAIPEGINDSKKMSNSKREILYEKIVETSEVGVGIVDVENIDKLNILRATMLAMKEAISSLPKQPELALIDGNQLPENLPCEAKTIVKGDSKSLSENPFAAVHDSKTGASAWRPISIRSFRIGSELA